MVCSARHRGRLRLTRRRARCIGPLLRQAEVQQLDALRANEDIGRFQIAVRDAVAMRCVQGRENLPRQRSYPVQDHRTGQRPALDQLHDQVVGADVVQGADMRVIERGHRTRFTLESLAEARRRELDGDVAAQPRVAGAPDLTHPAGSERLQ